MRRRGGRAGEDGFTLVEVAVALVVSAMLVAMAVRLLAGWVSMVRHQSERMEAQQAARVAVELAAAELRGVADGGFLLTSSDSVIFRSVRGWGVVCGPTTGGFAMVLPAAPGTTAEEVYGAGYDSVAVRAFGSTSWTVREAAPAGGAAAAEAAARCAPLAPAGSAGSWTVRAFASSGGTALEPFAPGYLFETVRYTRRTVQGQSWVYRSFGNVSNVQPLAGPVDPDAGLRFEFLDAQGAPAAADDARWARVRVVASSRHPQSRTRWVDTVETAVHFRNRP